MLTRNMIGGLVTVALGGAYLATGAGIRVSALSDSVGPRGLPVVYGVMMVALGALLVIQAVIETRRLSSEHRARLSAEEWRGVGRQVLRAAGLFGIAMAYVLVVGHLGYPLAICLLLGAVALYMGAPADWRLVVICVGGALGMWAIFVGLLDVRMPEGLLAGLAR